MTQALPTVEIKTREADSRLASSPALSALLLVGGPALVALLASEPEVSLLHVAAVCGALTSLAGVALARGLRVARWLALAGLGMGLWAALPVLTEAPEFALLFYVAATAIANALWQAPVMQSRASPVVTFTSPAAVQSGAACGTALWVALAISESSYPTLVGFTASLCLALPSVCLLGWVLRSLRAGATAALVPFSCLLVGLIFAVVSHAHPIWAASGWAVGLGVSVPFVHSADDPSSAWSIVLAHPARLIVATFSSLCVFGTLLLALPASSTTSHSLGLLDAAFTAVSAACVTGLVVVDTPSAFTGFGQATLLLLIQVGGLGIMTFYTVALRALGRRLGLRHELAVTEAASVDGQGSLYRALSAVLVLTMVTELCGAAVLSACFMRQGLAWPEALWRGLFTSVSAFCNAGFALDTQSLMAHQTQPVVLASVGVLIVLGGLAPAVVLSIPALIKRRVVPLQVQLVWLMTLVLLGVGFIVYTAFEWSHSLAALPWWHKLSNAAFQSVTPRTAGFNSLDLSATQPATQVVMIALMFIGGSPGGTAGGIKTTTVAVLFLAVLAALRGRADVTVFRRRVVHASVYRAAAVATVGVFSAMAVILALMLTQPLPPQMAIFEAVSALGTVGLSTGGTALLDGIGKVIIMMAMFIGRVGPLTLFLLLGESSKGGRWQFPDAEVDVG